MAETSRRQAASVAPLASSLSGSAARLPVFILIYMIALFMPMSFNIGSLGMSPLRVYLIIMTPILFVNLFAGRYGRVHIIDVLFILHMIWVTIAIAVNNPERVVETAGSTSLEFLGGYLVARAFIRDRASFLGFCKAWTVVVALTILPVLFEQVTGNAILMTIADAIPGVRSPGDGDNTRMGLERVQVVFAHPILYGLICSTAIPLAFVALKDEIGDTKRLFRTVIVSLCTFFSLSSGALLAMLLHFFMIGWAWVFARVQRRWMVLLILIMTAYFAIDLLSSRTPLRVFLTYATFSPHTAYYRMLIYDWGMINVWANPYFGIGYNDWVRASWMTPSVDNFWLLTAMRYGIPGFAFLAGGYFLLIWKVGRKKLEGDARILRYRRAWVFTLVGLCFTLTTVHIWSSPFTFLAFLLGAGVWFLDVIPETDGTPDMDQAPLVPAGPVYARKFASAPSSRMKTDINPKEGARYTRGRRP